MAATVGLIDGGHRLPDEGRLLDTQLGPGGRSEK